MNIEMRTQQTCCCNHTAQQSQSADQSQTGESFSAVFSSVSISTYFNPWTGNSVSPEQASALQNNSLQSVLQKLPNVKLDPNSWLSPDTQFSGISYVRTTAIRMVSSHSQDPSQFLQKIFDALQKNLDASNNQHSCGCSNETESMTTEATDSQATTDLKTAALPSTEQFAGNDHPIHVDAQTMQNTSGDYIQRFHTWKNTLQDGNSIDHMKAYLA